MEKFTSAWYVKVSSFVSVAAAAQMWIACRPRFLDGLSVWAAAGVKLLACRWLMRGLTMEALQECLMGMQRELVLHCDTGPPQALAAVLICDTYTPSP